MVNNTVENDLQRQVIQKIIFELKVEARPAYAGTLQIYAWKSLQISDFVC